MEANYELATYQGRFHLSMDVIRILREDHGNLLLVDCRNHIRIPFVMLGAPILRSYLV